MQRVLRLSIFPLLGIFSKALLPVQAVQNLGCQDFWVGPSEHNDVLECVEEYPAENWGIFIPLAIPLLFAIVFLVAFPIIFLGRCCGACGSNKQRPGAGCCCDGAEWDDVSDSEKAAVYHSKPFQIFCLKICAVILVMAAIISIVLIPVGAAMAVSNWNDFLDRFDSEILGWLEGKKESLVNGLKDEFGQYFPSINGTSFSMIDDILSDVYSIHDTVRGGSDTAVKVLTIVVIVMSVLPIAATVAILIFAVFNIRKRLRIFQCVFFPLGVLYGILSTVFLTGGLVFFIVHGEARLQVAASPGLFGWYVVPYCESVIKFQNIKDVVRTAVREVSIAGCEAALGICDSNPSPSGPLDKKQFYCPSLSSSTVDQLCASPADLISQLNSILSKSGSLVCPSSGGTGCTITECATKCTVPEMRELAAAVAEFITKANRASDLLTQAWSYASCDVLVGQFIKPLFTVREGGAGLYVAGAGLSIAMLCFIFGALLLLKGQKMFVEKPAEDDNEPIDSSDKVVVYAEGDDGSPSCEYPEDHTAPGLHYKNH